MALMDTTPPAVPAARRRLVIALAALAVVLVAAGVWAWHALSSGATDTLALSGNVDIHQVALAFNASERIAELRVTEGDRVRAGDVLGVLDTRTARLRFAQAQAQAGAQEQALLRLKSGSRPEELAQARANVAAADAQAQLATQQVERIQAVSSASAGRAVSQQDVDAALAHQKVALAQARAAHDAAELVIIGPRREDIAQAQSQLDAARAESALIQRQLDESELRAPNDAIVRARLLEVGDMASPQRPVYTLAIVKPKWVRAYVPEPRLGQLQAGMAASVTTDSEPNRALSARLGYISSVAEFTPKTVQTEELRTSLVYEVRFLVDDPQDKLRLGMPATVHLRLTQSTTARTAGQ
jgi:HlyD family secretion protein